ncbi:hypothetical protein [Nocardia sp. NPDC052112]|uniref:hypothetical protein n=1 Tax=Nocardia sp. NPDC052112 TaxID=3155646 RepID=UPI00342DFB68
MTGASLSYPQSPSFVIDRIPDPTATGDLILPLLQLDTIDVDPTEVELSRC